MKRKLPQWLLDATNNNDKIAKPNPTESIQKPSNDISPDIDNQPEPHPVSVNAQSEQIKPSNSTIGIVPLANLLSPSRGGIQVSESHRNVSNEPELRTADSTSTESESVVMPVPVVVKTEAPDANEPTASNATDEQQVVVKQEIKDEPVDTALTPAPTLVPKIEDVKPERQSCNYGIKCFRRNPAHRTELAHPGDVDYRRPNLPSAPAGTPACPWGAACYRRNPQHFIQLSHPPANIYNPTANTTAVTVTHVPQVNLPQRRNRNATGNGRMGAGNDDSDAEDDDYDLGDPFIDDGSSDEYVPDGDDDDDDEDDPEESQVVDS
ncbi:hypothetical protein HA402_003247 [Bradysia odoriphaga]|nr:hypothetical protein HA402_003247 [Bradysia odoriphaga]